MNKILTVLALAAIMLTVPSCGGDDSKDSESSSEEGGVNCKESNSITLNIVNEPALADFKATHYVAMRSGWSMSGDQKSERIMMYFANFDMKLGSWAAEMPTEEGQYIVEISLNGKTSNKADKLIPIEAGEYPFGSSLDADTKMSISIYKKGEVVPVFQYIDKVKGTAKVSNVTKDAVCGTFEISDEDGNTVKASASMKIEKDISGDF
jgi:hypothetical protein